MAKPISRPLKLYVYGVSLDSDEQVWYCIDLESLPETTDEQLRPIASLGFDSIGGWTLIGDYIYWAGTVKPEYTNTSPSMALYRQNIATSPNFCPLELVSRSEKCLIHYPYLFTLDENKILVLALKEGIYHESEKSSLGDVYNLDTGIWDTWAFNLHYFADEFIDFHVAPLSDENGNIENFVYYEFSNKGLLLFYNMRDDIASFQVHPQFSLSKGLSRSCDTVSITLLWDVAMNVRAVVMDSTMYWFTHELRLFGYDFAQKKWFHSSPLKEAEFWNFPRESLEWAVLVDVLNGNELLLLVQVPFENLRMAFLAVSKHGESLDVTVKSVHILSVDPNVILKDGIAVRKNIGSSAMHSKREAECTKV